MVQKQGFSKIDLLEKASLVNTIAIAFFNAAPLFNQFRILPL